MQFLALWRPHRSISYVANLGCSPSPLQNLSKTCRFFNIFPSRKYGKHKLFEARPPSGADPRPPKPIKNLSKTIGNRSIMPKSICFHWLFWLFWLWNCKKHMFSLTFLSFLTFQGLENSWATRGGPVWSWTMAHIAGPTSKDPKTDAKPKQNQWKSIDSFKNHMFSLTFLTFLTRNHQKAVFSLTFLTFLTF